MGRYGEIWGDMGRYGASQLTYRRTWLEGDIGRYGEIWGDMGRYGEIWGYGDIRRTIRRAPEAVLRWTA